MAHTSDKQRTAALHYRLGANEALERAALRLERMLSGKMPTTGETLALHNTVAACAAIVRDEKR